MTDRQMNPVLMARLAAWALRAAGLQARVTRNDDGSASFRLHKVQPAGAADIDVHLLASDFADEAGLFWWQVDQEDDYRLWTFSATPYAKPQD
jgi:exonuclease I